MNKEVFLSELRKKLSGLPQSDIDERVSFYAEMIDDRVEDGMTEEAAIEQIGSVESVVETIMSEYPLSKLVKAKVKPEKKMPVWAIILLVLGFPVWFPLLVSVLSVIGSVYLTLWCIVITLYALALGLAAGSIGSFVAMIVAFAGGEALLGVACFGCFLALGGMSVLLFFGSNYTVKGVVWLTKKMLLGIKSMFIGKEN